MGLQQEVAAFQQDMERVQRLIMKEAEVMKHGSCPQCPFSNRAERLNNAAQDLSKGLDLLERVQKALENCSS